MNVSALIGRLVSSRIATLEQLQSVYSLRDAYNLLELIYVDDHNQSVLMKQHG